MLCGPGLDVRITFDLEGAAMFEPLEHLIQQFVHRLAAMVASDLLMKVPPDAFNGIQIRGVGGQEENHDPIPMLDKVLVDGPAVVERGVVADHVNRAVTSQPGPQFLEMVDKQGRVASLALGSSVRIKSPVRQFSEPARYRFSLVPGVSTSACWPQRIHIDPILGLVFTSTSS